MEEMRVLMELDHRGPIAAALRHLHEAKLRLTADHFYARLGRAALVRRVHEAEKCYDKRREEFLGGRLEDWVSELASIKSVEGTFEVNSFMSAARAGLLRNRRRCLEEMIELRKAKVELPPSGAISG